MRVRLAAMVVVLGIAGMPFAGADQPQATHVVIAAGGLPRDLMAAPVSGEPFSAMWTTDIVRTVADGTKITHHWQHLVARDSAGRERLEQRLIAAKDGKPEVKLVYVMDPVAHTLTTWMEGSPTGQKVATVTKIKEPTGVIPVTKVKDDGRPQPQITTESLGSQVIDNLVATGERNTTIVPVGRSGNDQPITKTYEVWASDEMKLILLQKWSDPRTGDRTTQLADFSRAEPGVALFRPPSGYEVKTAEQTLRELAEKLEQAASAQE